MINVIEAFVNYLFHMSAIISEDVVDKARQCKEDYFAVTTAGAAKNRIKWSGLLENCPEGNARLFGYDKSVDSRLASVINGFNAHSLELDDGQRFAMIHLGASIVSAIDAASADFKINENDYFRGIILGYEAACRLSIAMQPSHKQKGYHTAGTCGTVGAAVGVGFALQMNNSQMKRIITLAAGSACGMLEIQEQTSEVKPYNLGRAAMDGLMAAYMGRTQFDVPDDMLGGERGFFNTFSDSWNIEKLIKENEYFEIQRIYIKPYASCRHSHSAVEAAILLRQRISIDTSRIKQVEVQTYRLGIKGHDHTDVHSVASAKLSTPYSVAVALLYGRADLSVFEPIDEKAVEFASKIKVIENQELTNLCPEKRAAIVNVVLTDGTVETERVEYAKGDPENPMTKKELMDKWNALFEYADRLTECNINQEEK